jgi:aldose 1-epimerase
VERRLPVSDPQNGHSNHGLLLDRDWDVLERGRDSVTMSTRLDASPGYPFRLDLSTRYALDAAGVTVTHEVRNLSAGPAPFALGAHPYLRVGAHPVDSLTLTIEADRALEFDGGWIPRGEHAVAGTRRDLRSGRRVADIDPHSGYTGLRVRDSRHVHRLTAPDGSGVQLWADARFGWVQVYLAPDFAADRGPRSALAVEPMTAPPNALRTGDGLAWIAPDALWAAQWGIRRVSPSRTSPSRTSPQTGSPSKERP